MSKLTISNITKNYRQKLYPKIFVPEGFDASADVREGQRLLMSLEAESPNDVASENAKFLAIEPKMKDIINNLFKRQRQARVVKFDFGQFRGIFLRIGHANRKDVVLLSDKVTGMPLYFKDDKSASEYATQCGYQVID